MVVKEKQRRYELVNNGAWEITKFTVEGCVTTELGEKGCEALLLATKNGQKSKGYFIELKGMSVRDALKQMKSSLNKTKSDLSGVQLFGRIVPSEYKRTKFLTNTEEALDELFRTHGGNLIIKENNSDTI